MYVPNPLNLPLLPETREPDILRDKKEQWLAKFQEKRQKKPKDRPPSSQYGHTQIRDALRAMSFHKCFYCESKLSKNNEQVDHYRELKEHPELAFEWNNLYLSCSECNSRKSPNPSINVEVCLAPCNKTEDPAEHLTFEAEYIFAKADSDRGRKTISKYLLDRYELNHRRVKQLHQLERLIRIMKTLQLQNDQAQMQKEREGILRFTQADHAFSLMFRIYLDDVEL